MDTHKEYSRRLRLHPGGYRVEETPTKERKEMITWTNNVAKVRKVKVLGLILVTLLVV
jgi:hypothetical protein